MTNTNNKIQLGLVAGRHPLPVDDFIISGEITNVLDFDRDSGKFKPQVLK